MTGDFGQSQVISERERSYWLCSAGGRCLVFPQLISTWLPGHKLSHFTAKQYTTRCFWKHLRREIGITVTEYWFIFDQRCLVWPFDRSLRVIDSCSETAGSSSALIGCFPPVCEILQMPLGAPEDTEAHDFFSDYLSHALLSGYSDRFIKNNFFNHICSISTHCCFNPLSSSKTQRPVVGCPAQSFTVFIEEVAPLSRQQQNHQSTQVQNGHTDLVSLFQRNRSTFLEIALFTFLQS